MSGEPAISASGELLYQRTLPVFAQDEKYGFFGRYLCDALMGMLQGLDQIVLDTPTHPGWTTILDPMVCPEAWLPWCAQLYGVTLPVGASVERQREVIAELLPQKRGTTASLIAAAVSTLTESKRVFFEPRPEGYAYRLIVLTIASQTPDEAVTRRALESQLAGGLKMIYEAVSPPVWDEAVDEWTAVGGSVSWQNVKEGDV